MISYYGKIEKHAISEANTINKTIAVALIKHFKSGVFPSQADLAKECYCSLSSTTNFAKNIEADGFRKLIILLKMEREKFPTTKNDVNVELKFDFTDSMLVNIKKQESFFVSISNEIVKAKNITIFSSSQCLPAANYLKDNLLILKKHITVINSANSFYSSIPDSDLDIVFLMGRDNLTIENYKVKRFLKPNTYAIISNTNDHLFNLGKGHIFYINHDMDSPTDMERIPALIMLSYYICSYAMSAYRNH